MRLLLLLIIGLGLAAPAAAEGELDGSAWLLKGKGLFSASDQVSFWKGHFIRRSCVRSGGQPALYDVRREGETVVWTAKEQEADGRVGFWEGVWNPATAVMHINHRYATADGKMESRELNARRYAQKKSAG